MPLEESLLSSLRHHCTSLSSRRRVRTHTPSQWTLIFAHLVILEGCLTEVLVCISRIMTHEPATRHPRLGRAGSSHCQRSSWWAAHPPVLKQRSIRPPLVCVWSSYCFADDGLCHRAF